MALSSRLRGSSALLFLGGALAVFAPAAGAAVPTGAAAVAAVNAIVHPAGTADRVISASYSADGSRVTYRRAFDDPATPGHDANRGADDWVMRADGSSAWRLTDTQSWTSSASAPVSTSAATWAPDGSGLAYVTYGPGHPATIARRVFTVDTSGDDWSGEQLQTEVGNLSALAYTPDSRFLVYSVGSSGPPGAVDYAIERSTSTRFRVRSVLAYSSTPTTTWAPECADVLTPGYTPAVDTGNVVIDALTGPNPGCKLGDFSSSTPTPTPAPATGSGGTDAIDIGTAATAHSPVLNDSPGVTPGANRPLVPISERIPSNVIPGPSLKITAIGKGLGSARKSGLHVKYTLDRIAKVKVWVILTDSGARYSTGDSAFAGVPATTIARGSQVSSKAGAGSMRIKFSRKSLDTLAAYHRAPLQVKVTATDVAGRSTTVVAPVTLR